MQLLLLSKALEWCIVLAYPQLFVTSGLQFGFKKMSTPLCTGTIKNIVSRYMFRGSSVFACFLDALKAFDLVNHGVLFKRLLDRDMPHPFTCFLLSWYHSQYVSVRWGDCLSAPFPCLMVCDKETPSPLFCSHSILMTCYLNYPI